MANDAEHAFMCLFALCISSLGKCSIVSFDHFHKLFSFFFFFPILGRQDGKSGLQLVLSLSPDHLYSKKVA